MLVRLRGSNDEQELKANINLLTLLNKKYLGFAVYNVALFATLGSIVVACLQSAENFKESYIVLCICIIQSTTVTICLVFGPKVCCCVILCLEYFFIFYLLLFIYSSLFSPVERLSMRVLLSVRNEPCRISSD